MIDANRHQADDTPGQHGNEGADEVVADDDDDRIPNGFVDLLFIHWFSFQIRAPDITKTSGTQGWGLDQTRLEARLTLQSSRSCLSSAGLIFFLSSAVISRRELS